MSIKKEWYSPFYNRLIKLNAPTNANHPIKAMIVRLQETYLGNELFVLLIHPIIFLDKNRINTTAIILITICSIVFSTIGRIRKLSSIPP